ncbi:uncharacterized protein LOC100875482 isoform X2 [Megachile rotundata]|uniref:uncharacterized protein LOC100875482 isoform X2 n=1 Tax=Megachile rotundata TaxID=143995 RepID=UPI003FD0E5C9
MRLIFVILVCFSGTVLSKYYEKTRFDRSVYESPTVNGLREKKQWTFTDDETNYRAYRDRTENSCYLEKLGDNVIAEEYSDVKLRQNQMPRTFYVSNDVLTKLEAWRLAGGRIVDFCQGRKIILLQDTVPIPEKTTDPFFNILPYDENDIAPKRVADVLLTPLISRAKRQIALEKREELNKNFNRLRSTRQTQQPQGKFRGQTQSQYLAIGNDDQKEGKAEAEATQQSSRSVVSGSRGMGQAQSMSFGSIGCEDCSKYTSEGPPDRYVQYPGAGPGTTYSRTHGPKQDGTYPHDLAPGTLIKDGRYAGGVTYPGGVPGTAGRVVYPPSVPGTPPGGGGVLYPGGAPGGKVLPPGYIPGTTDGGAVYPGGVPGGIPSTNGRSVIYRVRTPGTTGGGGVTYPGGAPGTTTGGGTYPGGVHGTTTGGGGTYPGGVPGTTTGGGGGTYPGGVPGTTTGGGGTYPGGVPGTTTGGGGTYPGGVPGTTTGGGGTYPGGGGTYPGGVPGTVTTGGGGTYPGGVPGTVTTGGGGTYPGGVPGTTGGGGTYPGGMPGTTTGGGVTYPGGIPGTTTGGGVTYPGDVPGTRIDGGAVYPPGIPGTTTGGGGTYPGGIPGTTTGGGVTYPGGVPGVTATSGAVVYPGGVPGTSTSGGGGVSYPGDVPSARIDGGTAYPGGVPGATTGGGTYPGGVPGTTTGGGVIYPGGVPGTTTGGGTYPGGVPGTTTGGGVIYPGGVPGTTTGGGTYPGGVPGTTTGGGVIYPGGVPGTTTGGGTYPGGVPGTTITGDARVYVGTIPSGGVVGGEVYPGKVPGSGVVYPGGVLDRTTSGGVIYPGGVPSTTTGGGTYPGGAPGTTTGGATYPGNIPGTGGVVYPGGTPGTAGGVVYPGGTPGTTGPGVVYPGGVPGTEGVVYPGGMPGNVMYPGGIPPDATRGQIGQTGQIPGGTGTGPGTANLYPDTSVGPRPHTDRVPGYPQPEQYPGYPQGQYPGYTQAGQYPGYPQGQYPVTWQTGEKPVEQYPDGQNIRQYPGSQYPSGPTGETSQYFQPAVPSAEDDNSNSQASSVVKQTDVGTQASASAQGKYGLGTAQSQVSGTYSGSGSFSAQAGSTDVNKSAQTEISGGKDGATSNAQGTGGYGKSQAQVQLDSESGATSTGAQSSGWNHGTNSQVQASSKGGMADAQANGEGSTSSQAQIGFQPYMKTDEKVERHSRPFRGGGTASAQSGTHRGQSQSQLEGSFQYGITYTGAAQAGSGSGAAASRKPFSFNLTDTELFKSFKPSYIPHITKNNSDATNASSEIDYEYNQDKYQQGLQASPSSQKAVFVKQTANENSKNVEIKQTQLDDTAYDYEEEYDGDEDDGEQSHQSQAVHLATGNQYDIHIKQDANTAQVGDMFQPGQSVSGYIIPPGFRGRVTSVAGSETVAHGDGKSQSQSVSLVPVEPNHGNKSPVSETRSLKTNRERLTEDHVPSNGRQDHLSPVPSRTKENSKPSNIPMKPSYYTVTNSVAGKMDDSKSSPRKYEHRYYTKSSTCGYFTFSCNVVYGSNGRTKICKPKMPTYPDGTPMKC